jgi:hypothetical protein
MNSRSQETPLGALLLSLKFRDTTLSRLRPKPIKEAKDEYEHEYEHVKFPKVRSSRIK